MIVDFFFWLFAAMLLISATLVVTSSNPVHSVLFLILAFFNAAALFLIAGAEFLAMILVVVYVGAVAVLFLFVVMMLDMDFEQLRGGLQRYAGIGAAVGAALLIEFAHDLGGWKLAPNAERCAASPTPANISNTDALGRILYTDYIFLFQTAGLVLLVAMIGAIVLTLRDRKTSRHQNIRVQTSRTVAETLEVVSLSLGAGTTRKRRLPAAEGNRSRNRAGSRACAPWPSLKASAHDSVILEHYLVVSGILLVIGVFGIFLNRKNVIIMLMAIELILLAVNLNLVAFSAALNDLAGQVMAMLVLTVAAAEAAIGLAIVLVYFRNRGSIQVEDVNLMKG